MQSTGIWCLVFCITRCYLLDCVSKMHFSCSEFPMTASGWSYFHVYLAKLQGGMCKFLKPILIVPKIRSLEKKKKKRLLVTNRDPLQDANSATQIYCMVQNLLTEKHLTCSIQFIKISMVKIMKLQNAQENMHWSKITIKGILDNQKRN